MSVSRPESSVKTSTWDVSLDYRRGGPAQEYVPTFSRASRIAVKVLDLAEMEEMNFRMFGRICG